MKTVYVVLEDFDEIVGLFYSEKEAAKFANKYQQDCYDGDWDVAITCERRQYTDEQIADILEDF